MVGATADRQLGTNDTYFAPEATTIWTTLIPMRVIYRDGSSYSFMYGDVWILVLNSHADLFPTNNPDFPGQYEYIAEELQSDAAQNAAFRLVAFHQAPYSNSSTSSTPDQIYGNAGIRDFWVPLFERFDVDSVISGHYHSYQRGELNGIQYLITRVVVPPCFNNSSMYGIGSRST